jgi:hypothetical protein
MYQTMYLDVSQREWKDLLSGRSTTLLRFTPQRSYPYGQVYSGDKLFLTAPGHGQHVRGSALAHRVYNIQVTDPQEVRALLREHASKLNLTEGQWARLRTQTCLMLIELTYVQTKERRQADQEQVPIAKSYRFQPGQPLSSGN